MNQPIKMTANAIQYVQKMLEKNNGKVFRLSIKKTGCSGYSYLPTLEETINPHDIALSMATNVTVFVDATWLHLLEGLNIDYVEEDKSGLKQKRLLFTNPNESSRCGCGESFHVE